MRTYNKTFATILITSCLFTASCSHDSVFDTVYPKEKVDAYFDSVVRQGMTKQEVENIFGKPYINSPIKNGVQYTQYNLLEARNEVYIDGMEYSESNIWKGAEPRFIKYKDGVVITYHRNLDVISGKK